MSSSSLEAKSEAGPAAAAPPPEPAYDPLAPCRLFPIPYLPTTLVERLMIRFGVGGPGLCTVCGRLALWRVLSDNLRETVHCMWCLSNCRQRQLAHVICRALGRVRGTTFRYLRDVARLDDLAVYNTESAGPVHKALKGLKNYACSEYFGPQYASGDVVHGVTHQDLMRLSFGDSTIDLVLSGDVFEHVAEPYRAHAEVHRVLRRGGRHIFTVPFDQGAHLDDVRADHDEQGNLRLLKEALYHQDPVRPAEGTLVYTIFGLEMLVRLARVGFRTSVYQIRMPSRGIFGGGGIVFDAVKA